MHLMLDQNLGFFVSYNSAGKGEGSPRSVLWQNFLDRYFPYAPPAAPPMASAAADAKAVAGTYWSSRRSQTTVFSVSALPNQDHLTVNSDGTISLDSVKDFAGNPKHFREIAPMLFREDHGQSRLAFTNDYAGHRIIVTDVPILVLQPVPQWKNDKLNLAILISVTVIFALTLLFWPVNAMLRWHYGEHLALSGEYRRSRRWARTICALNLVFIGGITVWLTMVGKNLSLLSSHFDGRLRALQLIGLLGVIGALGAIWYFVRSWREPDLWFWTRIWNTLLMLACLGYAFFLLNWHLLSFSLNY